MRSYLVVRHVVTTVAVALLLAGPALMVDTPRFGVPKLLFWSALGSAVYLYYRVRRLGLLPAYANLNISVVCVLSASFVAFQVVGVLWVLIW